MVHQISARSEIGYTALAVFLLHTFRKSFGRGILFYVEHFWNGFEKRAKEDGYLKMRQASDFLEHWRDGIPGGKGDKLTPKDVDHHQLTQGMLVEQEHTKDKRMAMEIALDHLAEHPDYYSRLKKAKL